MASDADDELPLGPNDTAMQDVQRAAISYQDRLNDRIASVANARGSFKSDSLEAVFSISHASAVHALALPPGGHSLYSGGQDGFIRRYSVCDTLNGIDSSKNLIMKQAGSSSGVLLGYWENADTNDGDSQWKWGPRSISNVNSGRAGGSPVFSMVVQSQEVFGLSGTQAGEINLWTVRHDEGQIRHIFRSSADAKAGHARTSVVSSLCLSVDEKSFYSGGWDSRLLQWDLATGSVVRTFSDRDQDFATDGLRANQVSSISLHPLAPASSLPKPMSPVADRMSVDSKAVPDVDADGSPAAEYDPLFDDSNLVGAEGDGAGATVPVAEKPAPAPPLPDFADSNLPTLSHDVLLSSSISGQALIWDQRAECAARRLPLAEGTPPWAACSCWSSSGDQIFVGRRDASVDVYDLKAGKRNKLRLPSSSGPISAISPLPGGRYVAIASLDTLRVYDLQHDDKEGAYRVIPHHYGSTVSQLACDPSQRVLAAAFGGRGWSEPRVADADGVTLYEYSL